MNNFNKCYSYKEINKINQNLNIRLTDKDKRILQHRIITINNIFHIFYDQINSKESFNKNIIKNLKKNIYNKTYVNISNKDIVKFIKNMQNENKKCKSFNKLVRKISFINDQLGGGDNNVILNISEISKDKNMYITVNKFIKSLLNDNWLDAGSKFIEMIN